MLNKFKPVTPSLRGTILVSKKHLSKDPPVKSLLKPMKSTGGRNNQGRITSRRMGGGVKRKYRVIDFKRNKYDVPGTIERLEYDPNRSAHIMLVLYKDGERRYIIAPNKLKVGDEILAGKNVPIKIGNSMPLSQIPLGTSIHCVEMKPKKGAQIARSAGAYAQLVAKDGPYALIRLRSGQMRKIPQECSATIGEVSNPEHNLAKLGKAGAKRWRGVRPTVRGVAMNPVDHPHGGGEGRTSGGRNPVTPWGVATKGKKTRKNKKTSVFIIKRRKK